MTVTNSGPLDGVVVADFSRVLAGPYATMLLGDLGATVIKVESPVGDDTRHWGPPWTPDGESTYFLSINRNKRSIALDLRSSEGRGRGLALVRCADVMIENGTYALTNDVAHGMGIRHPSICRYEQFPTADRLLIIAAGNDRQFRALCECLGLPQLSDDPRFATNSARVAHRDQLIPLLGSVLRTGGADEWFATLTSAGVPCGPINDVVQGMQFAESLGLEPIVDVNGSAQVANPLRLSATPVSYRCRPPALGADEDEILAWLDRPENENTESDQAGIADRAGREAG